MMHSMKIRIPAMALGLCCLAGGVNAANVEDIIRETQRMIVDEDKVSMVWWIPQQFWVESFAANPDISDAERDQILNVVGNYTIVALLRAGMTATQIQDLESRDAMLKNTRFRINDRELAPLPREDIQLGVLTLLSQLRPALIQAAGGAGEGLEFVVYPAVVDGIPVIDAALPGRLEIHFYDRQYTWRLPLGSLLPPKMDSETGESFPGNYLYNPYTGRKLDSD
jgi:hypothetical protein